MLFKTKLAKLNNSLLIFISIYKLFVFTLKIAFDTLKIE